MILHMICRIKKELNEKGLLKTKKNEVDSL